MLELLAALHCSCVLVAIRSIRTEELNPKFQVPDQSVFRAAQASWLNQRLTKAKQKLSSIAPASWSNQRLTKLAFACPSLLLSVGRRQVHGPPILFNCSRYDASTINYFGSDK